MKLRDHISKTPLEYKILLILVLSLTLGLGSYVIYITQAETAALQKQSRQKAHLFAESLKSGIRNVMLSGRPSYVRSLIEETRSEFDGMGRLRLFNNEAEEIFSEIKPFISRTAVDSMVYALLDDSSFHASESSRYIPLRNEATCQECHGTDHPLRGIVKLEFESELERSGKPMGQVAAQAFKSIMLSGKGETADQLLLAIDDIRGVERAQIYDEKGYYVAFGDDYDEVPEDYLEAAAHTFSEEGDLTPQYFNEEDYDTYIFPLENAEDCQVCHGSDHSVRGMFALSLDKEQKPDVKAAEKVIIEGFKNMMLMERGSYVSHFVSGVRKLPFITEFTVFDNGQNLNQEVQQLYVPNPDFTESVRSDSVDKLILAINDAFDQGLLKMEYEEVLEDGIPYLTQLIPLANDEKCQACHEPPKEGGPLYNKYGDRWKVRSVLEVSTSMATVQQEIRRNIYASISVGIFMIVLVGIILRIFIKLVVLNPLTIIGDTVGAVGDGNLGVSASIRSQDEIGLLADRINTMIKGLRERLHLTKFVSDETVEAVRLADLSGVSLGGERRVATVLFSDIRGFTAYSENVDPEQVIGMLNSILNEQAQVVRAHGGDIDKFVGDELMAVFQGEDMVERALTCSIELQKKIAAVCTVRAEDISIGIGINTGSMVMGAMGCVDRMDYTVIGDSVNLGARLCGVAQEGEIIVSEQSIAELPKDHSFQLQSHEPITVKGKQQTITIYSLSVT